MYESMTLLMHHDILFIIEIGLCQFSHFSMSLSYMLTCAYLSIVCMHTYFAFLVSLFIHIIHSFPNWYLFLFFLIPLSFMTKNGRNFWTSVHMHRRRYIDKGRLTQILTLCFFLLRFFCFFFLFDVMVYLLVLRYYVLIQIITLCFKFFYFFIFYYNIGHAINLLYLCLIAYMFG